MSMQNFDKLRNELENAGIDAALVDNIIYATEFEYAVPSLEAQLRGGYKFGEIIIGAMNTVMRFYDADSVLVISIDKDLKMANPEFEVHREGVLPICGTEPMYLNEYPEIWEAIQQFDDVSTPIPYTRIEPLLKNSAGNSRALRRFEQIGINSIMAMPYSKRISGYVAVINPQRYIKYPEHNTLLQVLSYVVVAEMNEMNLMACQKELLFGEIELAPNDVYVRLLNGFELRTQDGALFDTNINSEQCVLFLTHLLVKKGDVLPEETLIEAFWGCNHDLDYPERTLKNIGYRANAKLRSLFPDKNSQLMVIGKNTYAVNHKFNVIMDLDLYGYELRDIQGIPDAEHRIARYEQLMGKLTGSVLPKVNHSSLKQIDEMYKDVRETVQDEYLSSLYELGRYTDMHNFVNRISIGSNPHPFIIYWDIKSSIGMGRLEDARKILQENRNKLTAEKVGELESEIDNK